MGPRVPPARSLLDLEQRQDNSHLCFRAEFGSHRTPQCARRGAFPVPLSHTPTVPLGVGRATDWPRSGGSGNETDPACGTAVVPSQGLRSISWHTPGPSSPLKQCGGTGAMCLVRSPRPRWHCGHRATRRHKPTDGAVSSGAAAHDRMREHHR